MSELEKPSATEEIVDPGEKKSTANGGVRRLIVIGLVLVPIAVAVTCITAEIRELPWWCRFRAELGSADMQCKMGVICTDGGPEEQKLADEWFRKAAKNGSVRAQYALAVRTKDAKERAAMLKAAAEKGNADAQYEWGLSCFRDEKYAEAVEYYRKAADQGLTKAMHALAGCLLRGEGVAKDVDKAKELYRKAAAKGYGPSEARLEDLVNEEKKASESK